MRRFADFQGEIYRAGLSGSRPDLPMTAAGLERAAREAMAPEVYDYVAGSAGTESTAAANRGAFLRWEIVPRQLRGSGQPSLATELLGSNLPAPVLLAPIGALSAIRPEAELEVARAAAAVGVPMILSTLTNFSLEQVAAELASAHPGPGRGTGGWFQLYWPADPEIAASLVQRAQAAGYHALVVTVDTWTLAWRPRDLAHGYLPFHRGTGMANYFSDPVFRSRLKAPPEEDPGAAVALWSSLFGNSSLTWTDLARLRAETALPILVKGICHPDDARQALAAGLDGLIVSNHGGRQIDGARAALDCLSQVVAASGDLPVLFDSGIRTGSDVVKALALGARAVLLGRPYAFGLALAGRRGVEHALRCLLAELELAVGLSGHRSVAALSPEDLAHSSS
ncbi:MAG TPA: alpha-hydroxy-acid oxidizing protein [Candidatus Dormibacteraeota bacterium]|nr:alpha-hydroxy-acid oxidizing protein [Candidatus Dormibacteraeota bacterium]